MANGEGRRGPQDRETRTETEQRQADTDTGMHEDLLGPDLEAPLPDDILDDLRADARRKGIWVGLIER